MKIAITACGKNLDAQVSDKPGTASQLLHSIHGDRINYDGGHVRITHDTIKQPNKKILYGTSRYSMIE